jgi:hypothetical protein
MAGFWHGLEATIVRANLILAPTRPRPMQEPKSSSPHADEVVVSTASSMRQAMDQHPGIRRAFAAGSSIAQVSPDECPDTGPTNNAPQMKSRKPR